MSQSHDAIIIGAGIIGCATSYALGLKGWRVLNLDSLPACGYGSTSGSCAIIRPYYSTLDGSAMAYESHFYWKDWAGYLGSEEIDEKGLINYVNCGALVMKTSLNGYLQHAMELMDALDSPYDQSDLAGFYMAIGTSGNQFKNAPIVGEMMADLIEACENGNDQDQNPINLHLQHIDRTVTTGFYSRLREVNQDSSFSVLG